MTRKLKVAQVIARLNVGGAALYVMLTAAELRAPANPDFESLLVAGTISEGEADMRYIADEIGLPVHIIPELGREITLRSDFSALIKLIQVFRTEKPDVVHTHTAKAGFVGRVAAKLAGVPIIVHTFHGHVFQGYFSPAKTQFFLTLERLCARFTTKIVTSGSEIRRELIATYKLCPPEKIVVRESGLQLRRFSEFKRSSSQFRDQHCISSQAPLVGIVGRLVPIKNHELFLRAAAKVHAVRPHVQFVLVGDGELRGQLEALVKAFRLPVTFAGWIADTPPVYGTLDVLVLSSKNEGTPVSIIEAMAAGVPTVTTQVGGVMDLYPDPRYGKVVPPDDAEAMAQAILDALDHKGIDLAAAQRFVLETYDSRQAGAKHAELYRTLWNEAGHGE